MIIIIYNKMFNFNDELKKIVFNQKDIELYKYIIKEKLLEFLIYLYMVIIKKFKIKNLINL